MGLFKNYGAVKDSEDPRDLLYEEIIGSPKEALPLKFILPPERIKRIKNQGRTSSCVAQSASYVQGYQLKKDLSAKFAFKYCKILSGLKWGAYTRDGAKVAVNTGICDEDLLPEQKTYSDNAYLNFTVVPKALQNAHDNRAEIYVRVDGMYGNDFEVVKRFINREQRPVMLAIYWYKSYNKTDKDGVIPHPKGSWVGHCVTCVGWEDDNYVILNSFGEKFGKKGYQYLRRSAPTMDSWGIIENSFKVVLPQEVKIPDGVDRNKVTEKMKANRLQRELYLRFAPYDKARHEAGVNWFLLINALTYYNYTLTDCINWCYAKSRKLKLPFDLTNFRK